jgi:hypothetical protein
MIIVKIFVSFYEIDYVFTNCRHWNSSRASLFQFALFLYYTLSSHLPLYLLSRLRFSNWNCARISVLPNVCHTSCSCHLSWVITVIIFGNGNNYEAPHDVVFSSLQFANYFLYSSTALRTSEEYGISMIPWYYAMSRPFNKPLVGDFKATSAWQIFL